MKRILSVILLVFLLSHLGIAQAQPQEVRIVSLKPNITEILIALGAGSSVVGVTKYCRKPNDQVTIIGDYNSINAEAVMRLKPTLILGSSENSQKRQFESLAVAGLLVNMIEFHNYAEFEGSLLKIAELLGIKNRGELVLNRIQKTLEGIRSVTIDTSGLRKSFIIIVQRKPLMVASGNTFVSSLFSKAGLMNVFYANQIAYPVIDEEELIRESADFIFDISHGAVAGEPYLNKQVIPLNIKKFLATPQSVQNADRLFKYLFKKEDE